MVAVFKELRDLNTSHELQFWCDKKFAASAEKIFADFDKSIAVETIFAGKLRRYHGMGKKQFLKPSIFWPNVWDALQILVGFLQSLWRLTVDRPDVIFIKGGYVCLPVGYAAKLLKIPLVLHDSDAHPGLTNRMLAPFATMIATGAPLEYYNYPPEKSRYIGVPVGSEFRPYTEKERVVLKHQFGFDKQKPLIVVTGGGLGAVRINNAIVESLDILLAEASVFLISGHQQYDELKKRVGNRKDFRLEPFISEGMAQVLGAADLVIARAGATTLLELAALEKPTIIVPNPLLTAGHQLKNAKVYQDKLAAVIVKEDELAASDNLLAKKAISLLRAPKILQGLGANFGKFAKPDAAKNMASMITLVLRRQGRRR